MSSRNAIYVRGPTGFRLWWTDLLVLILAALLAAWCWDFPLGPGAAILTVVGHYFLFCNVTRMRGLYELVWALSYSALGVWLVGGGRLVWWEMTLVIMPVTIALTIAEAQSPRYRGVFAVKGEGR